MEPLEEEPRRRIPPGCSVGRIINMIVGFDFLLIMVTSVVVVGVLGGLDLMLPSDQNSSPACPLFMYEECTDDADGEKDCHVLYGSKGICHYVEVSYGFLALWSLVFFVIQIIRAVCKFDLWFTSIADLILSVIAGLVCFAAAVTTSVGTAVTCSKVSTNLNKGGTCDVRIPTNDASGDFYYGTINAGQGAAWMCLLFIFIVFVSSILRVVIFFRRRKSGVPMDMDTSVLAATDDLDDKPE